MPGHDAADEPRAEGPQKTHVVQRLEPHLFEVLRAFVAFVKPGEDLDLVADFRVGRKVLRLDVSSTETLGRLALGRVVLALDPLVHQSSGFERDGLPKLVMSHPFMRRYEAH